MEEDNKKEEISIENEQQKSSSFLGKKKQVKGKKLTVWVILMILIFMLFTFGLGIFLGKKIYVKDKNKNSNNQTPVEEKIKNDNSIKKEELTEKGIKNIMDRFKAIKIPSESLYKNDKYDISSITVNEMLVTALSKFNIYNVCSKSGLEVVLLDELNDELNKYVSKTLTIDDVKKNSVASIGNPYEYSYSLEVKDDKRIAVFDTFCGSLFEAKDFIYSKLVNGIREGDYIYIYEKEAFGRYNPNDLEYNKVDYYTDYGRTSKVVETLPSKEYTDGDGHAQSGSTPNWELYNTYKYTFKLVDGYFYFQSFELVK